MLSRRNSRSICLIASGLTEKNLRLQPWRYLHEVALQLTRLGNFVAIISDDGTGVTSSRNVNGILIHYIPRVSSPWWRVNQPLQQTIEQIEPDMILWHVGLTSFLHQQLPGGEQTPIVGIFTSPIYEPYDLYRAGPGKIIKGYRLSAGHILGTLTPKFILRQLMQRNNKLHGLVVQTQTTGQRLVNKKLWSKPMAVIEPGVDKIWRQTDPKLRDNIRAKLGYHSTDKVIVYFGSPAPLRGLHTLIKAFEIARSYDDSLRLLVLSRRHTDELLDEDAGLRQLLNRKQLKNYVQIVSGYLNQKQLVGHIAASDIVALPFELVPSDAPLSLLEAHALGKPVVTTHVACLPELAAQGINYLAQPANPFSLAGALRQAAEALPTQQEHSLEQPSARSWQEVGNEWVHFIQQLSMVGV